MNQAETERDRLFEPKSPLEGPEAGQRLRHGRADVGGLELHYVEAGEGPLVVLLHGFPEFWYAWRHQLPALARAGFRAVAPDLRGYNESDKPARVADYSIDKLSDDVACLIRALGEKSAFVIGHDWGGVVAWDFAMNHPELLRGLAALNIPHPVRFARGLRTLRQLKKSWYIFAFQLPGVAERYLSERNFEALRKVVSWRPGASSPVSTEEVQRYVDAWKQPGALTAALNFYRAAARNVAAKGRVHRIELPVLVVFGERDPAIGAELAEPDARWVPDVRVERLPEAGHFVQHDAPERVNELLVDYLKARLQAGA